MNTEAKRRDHRRVAHRVEDRRRARRVPVGAVRAPDCDETTPVSDLSQTGVYVHTKERLPIGSTLELRFMVFPEAPMWLHAHGRVVRHGDTPEGMGVEFTLLDDAAKDVIRKILLRHEARRGCVVAEQQPVLHAHGLVLRAVSP